MTDLCSCGHGRSEHTYKVRPEDHYEHCMGVVFAVPYDAEDDRRREAYCCCTSFVEADSMKLAEWGEASASDEKQQGTES